MSDDGKRKEEMLAMQRSIRIHDQQLLFLAERARQEVAKSKNGQYCYAGNMSKRNLGENKWTQRWFLLHQNLLFYFENIQASRPLGVLFLEGSYCERVILSSPRHSTKDKDIVPDNQVLSEPSTIVHAPLEDVEKTSEGLMMPVCIKKYSL